VDDFRLERSMFVEERVEYYSSPRDQSVEFRRMGNETRRKNAMT